MWSTTMFVLGFISGVFRTGFPSKSLTFGRFEEQGSLGGKICRASDVVFSIRNGGYGDLAIIECTMFCSNNAECMSIFYDSALSTCTGCSGVYDVTSPLDVSMGSVYHSSNSRGYQQSCLPEHVCKGVNQECFTDTCICSPGYSYNPSNKTCVDRCDTYGTTFQTYASRRIHEDNRFTLNGMSLNDCLNECISNAWCVSVDYKPSNTCNLQNVTALTTNNFLEVKEAYNYYNRDCA